MRIRKVRLNDHVEYHLGTGCLVFETGAVIELTVAEEELFELLLRTPKVTVPWEHVRDSLVKSDQSIRALMRGIRDKLGSRAIRTHVRRGISVQPQWIGTRRFALATHPSRLIPTRTEVEGVA